MANPDRGYGDDNDSASGWIIAIFILLSIIGIVIALTNKDPTPRCTTYYQGDEIVEDCP